MALLWYASSNMHVVECMYRILLDSSSLSTHSLGFFALLLTAAGTASAKYTHQIFTDSILAAGHKNRPLSLTLSLSASASVSDGGKSFAFLLTLKMRYRSDAAKSADAATKPGQ